MDPGQFLQLPRTEPVFLAGEEDDGPGGVGWTAASGQSAADGGRRRGPCRLERLAVHDLFDSF
jgi:hypothetical protein